MQYSLLHVYILGRKYQSDKRKIKCTAHVSLKITEVAWFVPPSLKDVLISQKRKLIQTASVIASSPDDLNCEPDHRVLSAQKRILSPDKENTRLFYKLPCNHCKSVKVNKLKSFLTKAGKGLQEHIHLHQSAELVFYLDGSAVCFNINNVTGFHSLLLQAFKYAGVQLETGKYQRWSEQLHGVMVIKEKKLSLKLTLTRQN